MADNSAYLLVKQILSQQKLLAGKQDHFRKKTLQESSDDSSKVLMTENRIYVGLNDSETKQQKFETERYKTIMKRICQNYHVPFSVVIEEGGYFHEDGEYTEERTLVLTLIDVEKEIVQEIAKDLCAFFHQESVLITEDVVKGSYIKETLL